MKSKYKVGDRVRICLPPTDSMFKDFNYKAGTVDTLYRSLTYRILLDNGQFATLSEEELTYLSVPGIPFPTERRDFQYTITLSQTDYVELMWLVLRHGRSHENGVLLSEHTLNAISHPETTYS